MLKKIIIAFGFIASFIGVLLAVFLGRKNVLGEGKPVEPARERLDDSKIIVDGISATESKITAGIEQSASTVKEQSGTIADATNAVDDGLSVLEAIRNQNSSN